MYNTEFNTFFSFLIPHNYNINITALILYVINRHHTRSFYGKPCLNCVSDFNKMPKVSNENRINKLYNHNNYKFNVF